MLSFNRPGRELWHTAFRLLYDKITWRGVCLLCRDIFLPWEEPLWSMSPSSSPTHSPRRLLSNRVWFFILFFFLMSLGGGGEGGIPSSERWNFHLVSFIFLGYIKDGILCHFVASMFSGFLTTAFSMPVDIAKTRYFLRERHFCLFFFSLWFRFKDSGFFFIVFCVVVRRVQNMKIINGVPEYKGAVDVIRKVVKNEGVPALWKGFTPYYMRIGSCRWNWMSDVYLQI